jgi:hypothetical protein
MKGYIIWYNNWEFGTCIDVQLANHVFEAIVFFARLHNVKHIQRIKEI